VERPASGTSSATTVTVGRQTVHSDDERAAVQTAVLGLHPLTDDQVAAVCEVIVASRTKWRCQASR
jgi:hypothetical protein